MATYTRISADEEHQSNSLEAQARLGSYIASQEGWRLVRQFSDQMTGATTERPDLQRMLTEARAGRFDLLLVYRVGAVTLRHDSRLHHIGMGARHRGRG